MTDKKKDTWPETLQLSDMHASEIVNWMQDFEQLASEYTDARGHYIRADLHAAAIAERDTAIAAAYEAAAQMLDMWGDEPQRGTFLAEETRAMTPADAIAARDADRARVRRQALEEAARETAIMPVSLPANPRMAFEAALEAVEHRIRAMIEEEGNE